MEHKFRFEEKRSRRATHYMILTMAKYGNHSYYRKFNSDADVKRFFRARGYDWDELVQTCKSHRQVVPIVENLVGSTWRVIGARAAIVTGAATEKESEITSVEGPGILTTSNYLQLFENAENNMRRCMESVSLGDFQSCISNGIASIDAYIAHQAWLYNSSPSAEKLIDNRRKKVPFDTKIDEWIPKMTGGKKLDKGRMSWNHFKRLQALRDDLAIHIKKPALGLSYQELGELLNFFRSGIAGLLVDFHQVFDEPIPCSIIRCAYLPDIKLVEVED